MSSYTWTVEIHVSPGVVAAGVDLSAPHELDDMLERAFPNAPMGSVFGVVKQAPSPEDVAAEQGLEVAR